MAFNTAQFEELIDEVTNELGLQSPAATELLLGTCAQESGFGTYLRQLGRGPARSVFMVEEPTFNDIKARFMHRFPAIAPIVFPQLRYDLRAAILFARIKYFSIPRPLPTLGDLPAQAAYWKQWYNTPAGKGTIEEYIKNFHRYVG